MITDLLAQRAIDLPDKTFVVTPEGEFSFGRINAAARRFASRLESLNVGEGDKVALIAENSAAFLVAWFGISYRGAVVVTLNNQLLADFKLLSVWRVPAVLQNLSFDIAACVQ